MSSSRWFYFQHASVSSSWGMSALQYLAHFTLQSRTFYIQGLLSLSLSYLWGCCALLSAAAESCPAVTVTELGDNGGQDLFNFSCRVKASLLLSVHPFLRTSSQIAAWPCVSLLPVARLGPCPAQHYRKKPQSALLTRLALSFATGKAKICSFKCEGRELPAVTLGESSDILHSSFIVSSKSCYIFPLSELYKS